MIYAPVDLGGVWGVGRQLDRLDYTVGLGIESSVGPIPGILLLSFGPALPWLFEWHDGRIRDGVSGFLGVLVGLCNEELPAGHPDLP